MLLIWKIRCLNTKNKQWGDRYLWLETEKLDSVQLAAIEIQKQSSSYDYRKEREWLKYRHLFTEGEVTEELFSKHKASQCFGLRDYFEDENGSQLTLDKVGQILTDNSDVVAIPPGATQADINFMLSQKTPINFHKNELSKGKLKTLGYFTQDLIKLRESTIYKEGPGSLNGSDNFIVETVASESEIESFIINYRRLRGKDEAGGVEKAVEIFCEFLGDNSLAKYVGELKVEFDNYLDSVPGFILHKQESGKKPDIKVKSLIEAAIYTRLAHQKTGHYDKCLKKVGGNHSLLLWYCLCAIYSAALKLCCLGQYIGQFYLKYCEIHNIKPIIHPTITQRSAGVGTKESIENLKKRLFDEQIIKLAKKLWIQKGCPNDGYMYFYEEAHKNLNEAMNFLQDSK